MIKKTERYLSQLRVPIDTLETLNDAIEVLQEKGVRISQPLFMEYLLIDSKEIAQIVLRNYQKHVNGMVLR